MQNSSLIYLFSFLQRTRNLQRQYTSCLLGCLLKNSKDNGNILSKMNFPNLCFVRMMAGHSKWQNIRHIKGAKDAERSTQFSELARRLRGAVIAGGSVKPEFNYRLTQVLDDARRINMPKDTIQRTLDRVSSSNPTQKIYEARGPGGCMLVIDAYVENDKRSKMDLNGLFKKYRTTLLDNGQAMHAFDFKTTHVVPVGETPIDLDTMVDMAIESGAEDVTMATNEDKSQEYRFICSGIDKHKVKKELASRGLHVSSTDDDYIPHMTVKVSADDENTISSLIQKLTDTEFVQNVYDNVDITDS